MCPGLDVILSLPQTPCNVPGVEPAEQRNGRDRALADPIGLLPQSSQDSPSLLAFGAPFTWGIKLNCIMGCADLNKELLFLAAKN